MAKKKIDDKNGKIFNYIIIGLLVFIFAFSIYYLFILERNKKIDNMVDDNKVSRIDDDIIDNEKINIKLSFNSVSIYEGDSTFINYSVNGKSVDNIKWVSKDNNIASVDNGIVYGNTSGKTIIVANYLHSDGVNYFAECEVIVNVKNNDINDKFMVNEVKFNDDILLVKTLDKISVSAKTFPEGSNDTVYYYSNDNDICSVDINTGEVSTYKKGDCIINAYSYDYKYRDEMVIYVRDDISNFKFITSLSLEGDSNIDMIVGETIDINVNYLPSDASDNIVYSTNNPSVCNIIGKSVKALKEGVCKIIAYSGNFDRMVSMYINVTKDDLLDVKISGCKRNCNLYDSYDELNNVEGADAFDVSFTNKNGISYKVCLSRVNDIIKTCDVVSANLYKIPFVAKGSSIDGKYVVGYQVCKDSFGNECSSTRYKYILLGDDLNG